MRSHVVLDSPVGPLTVVASGGRIACLYMELQRHRPADDTLGARDPAGGGAAPFAGAREQLEAYFAGELTAFDLPLAPVGSQFQQRVWAALLEIPYGTTESYGELARRIGAPPGAARAVGLANGRNPIGIVVPCHRVVGASGDLTGYGGGLERKQYLLDLERRHSGAVLF